ncbi:pullulanase-type alpha-1,6-glucosidase [Zhihengliuella halotolerans]|uniref:pullulanase-type alpha-1,6-glucosidase n=1 Tax=Zhihengliuella halotolerans TaxID=370736 RepID=UPI003BF7C2E4
MSGQTGTSIRPEKSPTRPRSRRRWAFALAPAVALGALGTGVGAPAGAEERTVTLVGSLQDELGCAEDWQPACEATELDSTSEAGVYSAELTLPAGAYEYKVALDGSWDEAYGLDGGEENIPLTIAGETTLRFTYDDATHRTSLVPLGLRQGYAEDDAALAAAPVRQPGSAEQFYFVMTDRFANGDPDNDDAGLGSDRLESGFDPADKGFFHGGDIAGLHSKLDYIEGLGTSAIWLTPSFKNQPVQGAGEDASAGYHGYWVTDFTQIDPHLGTNEELSALIADAHERDIKVYFDIITNHTADIIDYEEGVYDYVDQATSPYRDADGNPFDPGDYAGTGTFPELDAATSFPYTPTARDADVKVPEWLNDVTLYHNRGDSTWEGESVTHGDFVGLDDLMTEHPDVVDGFVDVYQDWVDLGIDGFRIDTAKHVNFEFWEQWSREVLDYAHANGRDEFFMFGEVYDADPKKLSPYVRDSDMNSVLDFTFQSAASGYAGGNSAKALANLYAGDDYYTTPGSSASALPTFLGNHDMGRIGHFLQNQGDALKRDELAHELMFLTRGQPVVYYGDEQGFAGAGGDKDARQSLFATEVAEYRDQPLITGENAGSVDRFDTDARLYAHIEKLSALRSAHPALTDGAQVELFAQDGPGVYALSRVARDEKTEYVVALNNAATEQSVDVQTLTADAEYTPVYGTESALATDGTGQASLTVPALSAVVLKADRKVDAPELELDLAAPAPGAGLEGLAAVSAELGAAAWAETSFAWRVAGADDWAPLGVAEDTTPRVFHDVGDLAEGTLVEYRAVATNADGERYAASTYASVGNDVSGNNPAEGPATDIDMVTVPGSHNSEMNCAGDWDPACESARLAEASAGVYAAAFDIPAGDYEYKAAINGSWDVNYGANGVAGGANLRYAHDGGDVNFYFDPRNNIVQSDADGPIVTLPGSLQDELGCESDWAPECLGTLMHDGDGDGVYEFTTDALPAGSYEVKVAHGLSWDENYGVDGVPGGENYAFSATAGEPVSFRYTLDTNTLEVAAAEQGAAGVGEARAHWIDAETLAVPADLGTGERYALYAAADAGLEIDGDTVHGAEPVELATVDGGLSESQREAFPHLADHRALRVELARDDVAAALRSQLALARYDDEGALTAYTGIQAPGAIDDLYADALAGVELGAVFTGKRPSFRLWAPTAQTATLLVLGDGGDPARHKADYDAASGVWEVRGKPQMYGSRYQWEVRVFVPETGTFETNIVTDPYSVALTTNSTHSVAVSLENPHHQPKQWRTSRAEPIENDVDRAIYELHVRDFSIGDTSLDEDLRGTYGAFAAESDGTAHLKKLADAGLSTVHLLPSFDIATIEEDRDQQAVPDCDLESFGPASSEQQACIAAIASGDGFNWGYDPYHFMAPEGSYAADPHGAGRVEEFRTMVGSLHSMGLEVVLDQVFNHTAASGQAEKSVLDRIVPGYYHRLDAAGKVETSTCCQNIATEHAAAEKLMVDAVLLWAKGYKVDGFRFDLMGHHSRANMEAVRAALDELTLDDDGVDGRSVYLYGEGWNFGEVADNTRFQQATQGQLDGTGIGTFNDRLRDAVHGGSPVDSSSTFRQGFGTGLGTDPNGYDVNGTDAQALADLGHEADLVRLGLAGNLGDFELFTSDGEIRRGDEIDYRGSPAGYASEPGEVVNYVDAHDNETLYDLTVFKLPRETTMADRARMNTLAQATVMYSQAVPFWHAGTELLRSKSLDRNSYDSGDWFNRIDWTGQQNTFGSGLPPAADNEEKWDSMAPLLEDPALKPDADAMAAAEAAALDLLRTREEVGLLRLGSADLIREKVSFPLSGPDATPGIVLMHVDDLLGPDTDPSLAGALVAFNASPEESAQRVDALAGREYELAQALADGADDVVRSTTWDAETGTLTIPARTAVVLVEQQGPAESEVVPDPAPSADPAGQGGAEEGPAASLEPVAHTGEQSTAGPGHLADTGAPGWLIALGAAGALLLLAGAGLSAYHAARRSKG